MKSFLLFLLILCTFTVKATYNDWFYARALRIDLYHTGNSTDEIYSIDELINEPLWGGSHVNLVDSMNLGQFYFKAFDLETNTLIFSHGFCSLFDEWKFTEEAKHTRRSFSETVQMPLPKKDIRIELYSRNSKGVYEKKFEYQVDVKSYFIKTQSRMIHSALTILKNGDPSNKIDIVILPEGYTQAELEKFKADCQKFTSDLFSFSPYKENQDKFNVSAVLAPSEESGTDIPGTGTWKSTVLNSSFYTFDSERYLMTTDNKSVRDLAANVPYDQIYLLVNSSKYGGGSIYNLYSTSVNSNTYSAKIYVHEFGHGFAGLADEYDDGSTSYNDMYPLGIEPWEPNLTTLVNFSSKWKKMLPAHTKIPSEPDHDNPLKLGVFEGGGYVSKGIYRPSTDCLMRSFSGNEFCPVCRKAIQEMIDYQSQ
ncbi:MAG: peptidase M64 [Bacteroidetes bacterium]|nr:peptidase M64 [Bacteroidota bacterium]